MIGGDDFPLTPDGPGDGATLYIETDDEIKIYDTREIHYNCTVEIWTNSKTGEQSIGWWENDE